MSTSEPEKDPEPRSESTSDPEASAAVQAFDEAGSQPSAFAPHASLDDPIWPPPESRPDQPAVPSKPAAPPAAKPDAAALLTKPEESPIPARPELPAVEPKQEMALSESTLHWLVDGEHPIEPSEANPILAPVYDPHAPVAGRKRAVLVIGGAAVLALGIAWALHAQAARHQTAAAVPTVETADLLIHRAEAALAAGRGAEALDLAHLAIVTDPGLADAYIVIGSVQRAGGQLNDARDSYRRYLELAPLGMHAAEAREALTSLPP
jgi:hypothetical protein